ncbi:hypothetical protein [Bradyrhizobium sp. SZCCHNR1051]|uniref:hypothetical protein n=1 Tax=Bradyrhizobium sp. SZCCHNR1051 TaxID=3057355 RepID=UPI0029162D34|nr:hypothetical protein [Bradyrhizobium sp. SZCCHNR1051]
MNTLPLYLLYNLIFHLVAVERDGEFRVSVLRLSSPNDAARKVLNVGPSLRDEDRRVMEVIILTGRQLLSYLELPATEIAVMYLNELTNKTDVHYEDFVARARAIHSALWRELAAVTSYLPSAEKVATASKIRIECEASFVAMPAVKTDILAGLQCWVLDQNDASVFHMMRAMEIGVQEFAKRIGVKIVQVNPGKHVRELTWGQILNAMSGPINALPQGTIKQKRRAERLKAAHSYLYGVKDAWRNPSMHPRASGYNDAENLDIINQVRAFLRELSQK